MLVALPPLERSRAGWLARAAAAAVGHRERVRGPGLLYTALGTTPLLATLHARGEARYEARFDEWDEHRPPTMLIRCSGDRPYEDLLGPIVLDAYTPVEPLIRPGSRVLDARCRTGAGAAWLGALAGPSGSVLALDPDEEAITFARRRYADTRAAHIAFERGGIDALAGELDGAFDAVVATGALPNDDDERCVRELWRVVRPGGILYVAEGGPRALRPWPRAHDLRGWVARTLGIAQPDSQQTDEDSTLSLCAVRRAGSAQPRDIGSSRRDPGG